MSRASHSNATNEHNQVNASTNYNGCDASLFVDLAPVGETDGGGVEPDCVLLRNCRPKRKPGLRVDAANARYRLERVPT